MAPQTYPRRTQEVNAVLGYRFTPVQSRGATAVIEGLRTREMLANPPLTGEVIDLLKSL
jgi:hypothetical protein